ncbi:MAG TPA: zinc ribbon domain-containing protein [Longimicrobiales bacterium]|nr:zinc ribbon domain-containing protein [Longimicrobiales bacterium]
METILIVVIALLAVGAIAFPLVRGSRSAHDAREYATAPPPPPPPSAATDALEVPGALPAAQVGSELELEIARYREAIQAGTLCGRCGSANGTDARFCLDCGAKLPVEDEREFGA